MTTIENFKMTERTWLSIYENIINALNDENLKLVDVATKTGITRQRLADVRTNKRLMTFAEAEILIKALNL